MEGGSRGRGYTYQFSSVQSLSHVPLFATPWTAACWASLSIANSRSLLKLMSIESVMPFNSPVIPFFSCPQSFSASGSFQMSQLFASGGQSIGVSASTLVLPMNIQDSQHFGQILYHLSHQGSPRILEWIIVSPTIKFYFKFWICGISSDEVSSVAQLCPTHESQHARPPCPSQTPRVHPNPCPLSW